MLLKVGELARRTGLTVRTLHHYDAIGLLAPSARSDAGYRLYDAGDLARLHAIQALRQIGLPLAEIGRMLGEGGGALPGILARQIEMLDAQIAQARTLRERLDLLRHRMASGAEPDTDNWLGTLELMGTYTRYFSAAELRRLFDNYRPVEAGWPPLVAEVRAAMQRGVPSDAPEVQPLAFRWMAMMTHWMDGDADLMARWARMYLQEPQVQAPDGPTPQMIAWIGQAIALRMAALTRHLAPDELQRLGPPPVQAWRRVGEAARALMAQGLPPESPAALALARESAQLFDALVRHDAALGARLMAAHDAEPLLQAASVFGDAATGDYLRRAGEHLLPRGP